MLSPPGEVDLHLVQDVGDEIVAGPLRLFLASLHRLAGVDAFVAGGSSLGLQCGRGGVITGDGLLQFLGHLLGNVAVHNRRCVARRAGVVEDRVHFDLPAVADPHRDRGAVRWRRHVAEVQFDLPDSLLSPWRSLNFFRTSLHCDRSNCDRSLANFPGSLSSLFRDSRNIWFHSDPSRVCIRYSFSTCMIAPAATSFSSRTGTFLRSSALLLVRSVTSRSASVSASARTPASAGPLCGKLADEKYQRAELVTQFAVIFLLLPGDGFGDFLEQDAGLKHARLDVFVQERAIDHCAERNSAVFFTAS